METISDFINQVMARPLETLLPYALTLVVLYVIVRAALSLGGPRGGGSGGSSIGTDHGGGY